MGVPVTFVDPCAVDLVPSGAISAWAPAFAGETESRRVTRDTVFSPKTYFQGYPFELIISVYFTIRPS